MAKAPDEILPLYAALRVYAAMWRVTGCETTTDLSRDQRNKESLRRFDGKISVAGIGLSIRLESSPVKPDKAEAPPLPLSVGLLE